MAGYRGELRMYGAATEHEPLSWPWVEDRLSEPGTMWVTATSEGFPHPRPVWGVWYRDRLHLSIGTPSIRRRLSVDPRLTVHLDSGTDVVIVEGHAVLGPTTDDDVLQVYNAKYDWSYDVEQYGPLTQVHPQTVLAWRTAGPAGRDGFTASAKWSFDQTR